MARFWLHAFFPLLQLNWEERNPEKASFKLVGFFSFLLTHSHVLKATCILGEAQRWSCTDMFRNWYGLFLHFFITGFAEIGLLACHFLILSLFLSLRTLWDSTIWFLIWEQGCQYSVVPEKWQLGTYRRILKL